MLTERIPVIIPLLGDCLERGIAPGEVSVMLPWLPDDSSRRTRAVTNAVLPSLRRAAAARRTPAPAPRRRRSHADRPRRRPLLQGVHLPDRAGQDAPDDRDGRVARPPARGRPRLPRERRLRRRSRQGRGLLARADALASEHRFEEARRGIRQGDAVRRRRRAPPSCASALLNGEARRGPATATSGSALALLAESRVARRGRRVLRRRPRRRPLPDGRLPHEALEHLDGGRPVQRGARPWRSAELPSDDCA